MLNRNIPGQMADAELLRLCELASKVPEGGIVVEVGCLYGLSSWHISMSCAANVTLFCIDPWKRERWIIEKVEKKQIAPEFSRAAFQSMTADCKNIVMIQGASPEICRGWKVPIDMYFEDAVHTNPVLRKNISFWSELVRPGGIVSGHDYCDAWPDVKETIDDLATAYGMELSVVSSLWSMQKPAATRR